MSDVVIPASMLPTDGRFGSGPSKVRPEAVQHLAAIADGVLGTSHRREPVRAQVGRLRTALAALYKLPDDYEILVTVGGATAFWESLTFGFVERRARHYVFGEFGGMFAAATAAAPFLEAPERVEAPFGERPDPSPAPDCDIQALTHNETSTGVMMDIRRDYDRLVVVDGTSAAGGLYVDPSQVDVYYFSLQKGFASEGGLTVAFLSPAAVARVEQIAASNRYIPKFLDISTALENSRDNQTYNTPSISSVILAAHQAEWMLETFGDLRGVADAQATKASIVYDWAEARDWATPFVAGSSVRSHVVATVDMLGNVDADAVNAALRANGVLDTFAYRGLKRNQLRIALFAAITADDLRAYTACVDEVVRQLYGDRAID
ncbi:MAG: phosphoserine transaminase [Nitriliruptoraceae bacterium]